ncbi:hypothetical protein J2Y41_004685 [Arthrobacter sp. 1088]|nr:hypothetical protein [Arthrobacter sp. 1088]
MGHTQDWAGMLLIRPALCTELMPDPAWADISKNAHSAQLESKAKPWVSHTSAESQHQPASRSQSNRVKTYSP